MPVTNAMKKVLGDGVVERREVPQLSRDIGRGTRASDLRKLAGPQFVDALEGGTGDDLVRLGRQHGVELSFTAPVKDIAAAGDVLAGRATLKRGGTNREASVVAVQRGLMALSSRLQQPKIALPNWGADGDYGGETEKAVVAFQTIYGAAHGLTPNGEVDDKTAKLLNDMVGRTSVPKLLVDEVGAMAPSKKTVLAACDFLLKHDARLYGTQSDWRCRDPKHPQFSDARAETDVSGRYCDVSMNGSGWKCNLALGTALYLAGFEPPRYPSGAYPIATELFRYTKAIQGRNARDHVELDLKAQVKNLDQMSADERRAKVAALIDQAEPGQLLIVDHGSGGGADGGHCRIIRDVSDWNGGRGTIRCFQASSRAALDKDHVLSDFTGEKHVYLLEANTPREA